jgi:hypothetical protein
MRHRWAILNVAILLFVAFPLWYLGRWRLATLWYGPQGGTVWGGLVFNLVSVSGPLIVGGVLQQGVLTLVPHDCPAWQRRGLCVMSTTIVLAVVTVFQYDVKSLFETFNLLPMAGSLILYGLVCRMPPPSIPSARPGGPC